MLFSEILLTWYDQYGRKNLPWQVNPTPYRVWVSEIMLQQTQVTTVIPYYEKFMKSFPNIASLALAPIDEVLQHWAGLGYYARARNLHKAANQILERHDGEFPNRFEDVIALSGIGRSTAGAILAFSYGQRHPILDGNVKRVLCRYLAIEGYPGQKQVEQALWQQADNLTPSDRVDHYTQAIMDLGATLCTRRKPLCLACPVSANCEALKKGMVDELPHSKPKSRRALKTWITPIIRDEQSNILVMKRPPAGIWGGVWSLPPMEWNNPDVDKDQLMDWCLDEFGIKTKVAKTLAPIKHGFTHFDLTILPCELTFVGWTAETRDKASIKWAGNHNLGALGMPAPIDKLLSGILTAN